MKRTVTRDFLLAKAAAAAGLYLGLAPLYALSAAALAPSQGALAAFLPFAALALTLGAARAPAKLRRPLFAGALALTAACGLLFRPFAPVKLLLAAPALLSMLLFMPAVARPPREEWTPAHAAVGIGLYLGALALARTDVFAGADAALRWLFSAYLLLCVFFLNRRTLVNASGARGAAGLLARNRRLLALCCLVAVPVANLRAVGAAVRAAALWLVRAVFDVALFLSSLFPISTLQEDAGTSGGELGLGGDAARPSAFAEILNKIMIVLAIALVAALVLFALYKAGRALGVLLRKLWQRLRAYSRKIGEDYVDTSETLLRWKDVGRAVRKSLASRGRQAREKPWEQLSARETIRRVYARLLARAGGKDPARTARETLADGGLGLDGPTAAELASLYDEARYSAHPLSPDSAAAMRRKAGI